MSQYCKSLCLAAALFMLLGMGSMALAQMASPETQGWQNSWTGYLWVPGLHGDTVVRGVHANVDVSLGDAFDALGNVEASFSAHYEGNKEPWGIIADINYWRMGFDFSSATYGNGEVKPSQWIIEFAGAHTLSAKRAEGATVQQVQLLVGARYNRLKVELKAPSAGISREKDGNYFDPFVGVRMFQALSPKWGVNLRADAGGFGIGSDMAWQVIGTFGYNISSRNSILLGWRYYSQDYSTGSGTNEFTWNVAESGPFFGFQTRF